MPSASRPEPRYGVKMASSTVADTSDVTGDGLDERPHLRTRRKQLTDPRRWSAPWVVSFCTFAVLAGVYIVYVVRRFERLGFSGWDLGIFTQAVRAYSRFEAPIVPLEGTDVNLMGDHFQPWIALIGPIYRIFPSPMTLLVVQALLFALAAIPIVRLATKQWGVVVGVLIAVAYGMSWGISHALAFDFHEIALAVPLLAFSLVALVEGRWRAALLYALPLVFCKEDLGLTVVVLAAVVAWRCGKPAYRWAAATAVWGLGWTAFATKVVIPALGSGDYSYGTKFPESPIDGVKDFILGVASGDARASTAFMLLVITLFLGVRSPIALIAVPTIVWRFWSTNYLYWSDDYHYDAILMPIMFVAMIDALMSMDRQGRSRRVITGFAAGAAVVALILAAGGPLHRLGQSDFYSPATAAQSVDVLVRQIPAGDSVAATNNIAPQLVSDYDVTLFPRQSRDRSVPEWIIVDKNTYNMFPTSPEGVRKALDETESDGQYREVGSRNGVVLLHRR
ncbi:UNVERIFIED_CONTAM: putative membrane protein [Williamsia faeni]